MAYRGVPFPPNTHMFPSRAHVYDYLQYFARSQSMLDVIRFRTEVVHARRVQNGWRVTSRSLDEQSESNDVFDAILVANGNCATPHIPSVPGLDHFRGRQMHSAWYRNPDTLNARRILIVGSNSSGSDIARELCGGAVRQWRTSEEWQRSSENVTVYQSYHDLAKPPQSDYDPRDPASPAWCRRIHVVGPIQHIDEQGALVFSDGARLEDIDLIIWATGFLHNVSLFQAKDEPFCQAPLIVHNQHTSTAATIASADTLHHLDDWMMFYKPDPSLCFIGLPKHVVPFPLVQLQSRVAAHVLLGKIPPLPRVRAHLPISDPERWIIDEYNEAPGPEAWGNFILGREAEFVYTDTLLSLLPRSQPPEWQPFPPWRRELRRKGIEKRRELLGY